MKETIQVLYLREDSRIIALKLRVDEMSNSIITQWKKTKRHECYLLIHKLMKPVFNFPGIKDGTRAMLICSRDVRFDPLQELDDSWNKDNIRDRLKAAAVEQQHRAEQSKTGINMSNATLMLAACAAALFVVVSILAAVKYLGG